MRFLRRIFCLPFFPIIVSPFVLFAPTILSGRALFWGTPALQFMPWWSFAWETLRNGQIPLWNPLVGMGAPLLANYQSALFYPPNWIYLVLDSLGGTPLMAWGMAPLAAIHLAAGGVGMAMLVRKLGMGKLAQTVGGLSFSLSGYLVARAGFLSITSTVIWLPWLLLLGFTLAVSPRYWRTVGLLGLLLGIQLLAGHAQTVVYSAMLVFAWVGFWAWRAERSDRSTTESGPLPAYSWRGGLRAVARSWLGLLFAGALAVAIAAVQLLPTAEYLGQSQRAGALEFDFALTYSFWPWRFLTFISPDLFGSPVRGDYWGYGAFWEDAVYIGLVPLLLAAGAVYCAIRSGNQDRRAPESPPPGFTVGSSDLRTLALALAALIAVSFLLALGKNTPVFPWLYRNIPGFDMFQAPARYTIWAIASLAILASLGADRWRAPEGRGLYWTRLATAGALALLITAGLGWVMLDFERVSLFYGAARAGFFGILAGLLTLRAPARDVEDPAGNWAWAAALVVAADLILAGWGLNPGVPLEFYEGGSPAAARIKDLSKGGRLYLGGSGEYNLKFKRFFLLDTFAPAEDWFGLRSVELPNLNMLDGIPHSANFDPLLPARYARWIELIESTGGSNMEALLNLSGVTLVEIPDLDAPAGVRFLPVTGGERLRWFSCAVGAPSGEEALQLMGSQDLPIAQTLVIEGIPREFDKSCVTDAALVELAADTPGRLEAVISAGSDGWLYVADTWYPGWEARLDGNPVELLRTNYLFRAVAVPAGVHEVELVFNPGSFRLGLLITAFSLALLAGARILLSLKARRS